MLSPNFLFISCNLKACFISEWQFAL
uniref:Uncharacterized protein n=1 Tax=Arundo donax TaxID=35708 RepID=A0A0A9BLW9_ARUDO